MVFVRQIVLVLSETVLVLVLDWTRMSEPIFDHDRLDGYRLSIISMLTRLIQRTATVAEDSAEYEHEIRRIRQRDEFSPAELVVYDIPIRETPTP
jgi:hypothetical protein